MKFLYETLSLNTLAQLERLAVGFATASEETGREDWWDFAQACWAEIDRKRAA